MDNITNGSIGVIAAPALVFAGRYYSRTGAVGKAIIEEARLHGVETQALNVALEKFKHLDITQRMTEIEYEGAVIDSKKAYSNHLATAYAEFPKFEVFIKRKLAGISSYAGLAAAIVLGAIIGYNWNGWFGKGKG